MTKKCVCACVCQWTMTNEACVGGNIRVLVQRDHNAYWPIYQYLWKSKDSFLYTVPTILHTHHSNGTIWFARSKPRDERGANWARGTQYQYSAATTSTTTTESHSTQGGVTLKPLLSWEWPPRHVDSAIIALYCTIVAYSGHVTSSRPLAVMHNCFQLEGEDPLCLPKGYTLP